MRDTTPPKYGLVGTAIPLYETEEEYRRRLEADFEAMRQAGERVAERQQQRVMDAVLGNQHGPPPAPASE